MGTLNVSTTTDKECDIQDLCELLHLDVLALQETQRVFDSPPFNIAGYYVMELRPPLLSTGMRGCAVLVKRGLQCYILSGSTNNIIWVKIAQNGVHIIICAVYIPTEGADLRENQLNQLAKALHNRLRKYPNDPLIVLGDFNHTPAQLKTFLETNDIPLDILPLEGVAETFQAGTVIDYILVNPSSTLKKTACVAHHQKEMIISDHYIVTTVLKQQRTRASKAIEKVQRHRLLHGFQKVARSPIFDAGRNPELEGRKSEDAVQQFVKALWELLKRKHFVAALKPKKRGLHLNGHESRVIRKKNRILADRREERKTGIRRNLTLKEMEDETKLIRLARSIVRKHRLDEDVNFSKKCCQLLMRKRMKDFWVVANNRIDAEAKRILCASGRVTGMLKDEEGNVITDETLLCEKWAAYFEKLYCAGDGHSQNATYWADKAVNKPKGEVEYDKEVWDADISAQEVIYAIHAMKNGKSAGNDNIPVEVYKAIVRDARKEGGGVELFHRLVDAVNTLFNGFIPSSMMISVVVPIFKKGDSGDPANYRGISLMNVLLKIVCSVVAQRLQNTLDGQLTDAQAGFRPGMQCAGHVLALIEIIQRWKFDRNEAYNPAQAVQSVESVQSERGVDEQTQRRMDEQTQRSADEQRMREVDPSIAFEMDLLFNRLMESMSESEKEKYKKGPYACFIDFQKAYDTVPHQALLHKLRAYGITGRVYHFIETLYSHSTMQVRINGVYSREFPLQRGLRQGCPLSPILFSLFINDILPEAPCRPDRWWPKVDCLLYADDVCLFAPSELQLRSLMAQVSEWADTWEMTIGQSKCGVMKFTPKGKEELERRIRATGEKWLLQGKEISPVEEYKYLGLVITQDLNLRRMVEARVQVAKTKLNFMARFLTNFCIPAPIRVHVLKAVFMPLLSYGAEVWAVSRENEGLVESILYRAMSYIIQSYSKLKMGKYVAYLELDIVPLHMQLMKKRLSVAYKGKEMSAVLAHLMSTEPFFSTTQTPILKTIRTQGNTLWTKKLSKDSEYKDNFNRLQFTLRNVFCNSNSAEGYYFSRYCANEQQLDMIWPGLWRDAKSEMEKASSCTLYLKEGLLWRRSFMDMWYVNPQLGRGFQQLLQIRTHMWEIVRAVKVAKGKRGREDVCPCCREKVKETPYHHIAECSAFESERRFMIRTLLHSRGTINDIWDTLELVLGKIRPNTESSDEVLLDSVFTPRNKRIATEFALPGLTSEMQRAALINACQRADSTTTRWNVIPDMKKNAARMANQEAARLLREDATETANQGATRTANQGATRTANKPVTVSVSFQPPPIPRTSHQPSSLDEKQEDDLLLDYQISLEGAYVLAVYLNSTYQKRQKLISEYEASLAPSPVCFTTTRPPYKGPFSSSTRMAIREFHPHLISALPFELPSKGIDVSKSIAMDSACMPMIHTLPVAMHRKRRENEYYLRRE